MGTEDSAPMPLTPAQDNGAAADRSSFQAAARELLASLCRNQGKRVLDRTSLQKELQKFDAGVNDEWIKAFFDRYSHIFKHIETSTLAGGGDADLLTIEICIRLALCMKYCSKEGCKDDRCKDLHCCKFNLFGACQFGGGRCKFDHNLRSSHNLELLRQNAMDELSNNDVGLILRRAGFVPQICKFYNVRECTCKHGRDGVGCPALHVCRHFVLGGCKFGENCKRSHDIYNPATKTLLTKYGFDVRRNKDNVLSELAEVLKAEETEIGPEKRAAVLTGHSEGQADHVASNASRSTSCKVTPASSPPGSQTSTPRRMSDFRTGQTQSQTTSSSRCTDSKLQPQRVAVSTSSTVCSYHLFRREGCSYGSDCRNYHSQFGLPYQWQWQPMDPASNSNDNNEGVITNWSDFGEAPNTTLEQAFWDPAQNECHVADAQGNTVLVSFAQMSYVARNGVKFHVRRIGTESVSAELAVKRSYSTLWLWFIAKSSNNGQIWQVCDSYDDIEQEYLENPDGAYKNPSNPQGFEVDFRRMVRTDTETRVEQEVRRRPDKFNAETKRPQTVSEKITAMKQLAMTTTAPDAKCNIEKKELPLATVSSPVVHFPSHWEQLSTSDDSTTDCQLVTVATSDSQLPPPEYLEIKKLLNVTMPGPLKSLKRIQNKDLWEDFSRLRSRWEKKRGSKLDVRRLFHGTSDQYIDAICQQGFDPRVAGMSVGTLYGKGSYFARDASYSKSYCRGGNKMFVVQVIVGEFTVGQPHFTRPPAKDSTLPLSRQQLFESCVDNKDNPSIFVVFDRHQAYPEYLIEF